MDRVNDRNETVLQSANSQKPDSVMNSQFALLAVS